MYLLESLLSGVLFLVLPIVVVVLIFRYLNKGAQPQPMSPLMPSNTAEPSQAQYRDQQWRAYIASFKNRDIPKDQTALVDMMLTAQDAPDGSMFAASDQTAMYGQSAAVDAPAGGYLEVPLPPAPEPAQEVDGTLLLLYFGAFLFVASAGLFVAFSGLSGGARTLIVIIAMLVMYYGGFWLHERSSRLRPAGIAFTAIGMAIAPLVGVTAYHFVAGDRHAPIIWLITSALCLSMYAYALRRLRSTFISYLVIFSFLSLFESAVSITSASVYYYVWGLILAGMLLRFTGFVRESAELQEPAAVSAQVLIPLSLFVSFAMIPGNGIGQLSVSLLLSAVYYTLEALLQARKAASIQSPYLAVGAHVLYLAGISAGIFALFHSRLLVATGLVILAVVQTVLIDALPARSMFARNFASVAYFAAIPAFFLAFPNGVMMAIAVAALTAIGALSSWRQQRSDMYAGAALAFIALPFVVGQLTSDPHWSASVQTAAAFIPVIILWRLWAWLSDKQQYSGDWLSIAMTTYVLSGAVMLIPAFIAGGWLCIVASVAFAATLAIAARSGAGVNWWAGAGLVVILPVLREMPYVTTAIFSTAVGVALVANIAVTLMSRAELNRWFVALLSLLAPVAIGAGGLGFKFGPVGFAYTYLFAMFCLLLCRSLARGVYLVSVKAPIASLYRSASLSYVFGYIVAATLAVAVSLAASDSHLHTSLILAVLLLVTPYIAVKVEKNKRLLAFVPWLFLAMLVSVVRPTVSRPDASLLLLATSALAVVAYTAILAYQHYLQDATQDVLQATLVLAYAPLLLGAWYNEAASILPLTLGVAGFLTLYYFWDKMQANREVSGGVIVLALLWLIHSFGVENPQAYTHIVAAVFALYAYWRFWLGDRETSDQYLYAMLGTATIPLAMQALGGTAGGAYGWWLLLEQVGFMLLGIYIRRRFVVMWGLYVALGAVLYQLRNLGWAALSFLALFVIGMAVWRLLRSVDHHDGPR